LEIVNKTELKNVKGGAFGVKLIMGILSAGSFIIGLIDGFLRPLKCRNR